MSFVTLEHDAQHAVIVNTDLITYILQDHYGTALHFQSGERIVCPIELDAVIQRLFGNDAPKAVLLAEA